MKDKIKLGIGILWLITVLVFYYHNHGYYGFPLIGLAKWWIIWLAPIILYCSVLFFSWAKGHSTIQIRISSKRIIAGFFLLMLFIGNAAFFVKSPIAYFGDPVAFFEDGSYKINPTQEEKLTATQILSNGLTISEAHDFFDQAPEAIKQGLVKANIFQIEFGLLWTYIKVYGSSFLFLLLCFGLGSKIFSLFKIHERNFESSIIKTVLGTGLITTIFFLIAAIGQFKTFNLLVLLLIIAIIVRKEITESVRAILKFRTDLEFDYGNLLIPIFLICLTFLGINLFDNLSPLPRGWDGLNRYILSARDISEGGELIKIGSVYAWELIIAFFYGIDEKIALFWTAMPGILNFILLFLLIKKFNGNTVSALSVAILISLPMATFYLADENKIDLAHWLYGTASIVAVLLAIDFENHSKPKIKNISWIFIAALIAGYAFTIKFTAVLLILSLLSVFAYLEAGFFGFIPAILISIALLANQGGFNLGSEFITSEKTSFYIFIFTALLGSALTIYAFLKNKIQKKSLKELGVVILLIILPIFPWLAKNAIEIKSVNLTQIINGIYEKPEPDFQTEADPQTGVCTETGFFEEFDRYLGYNDNIFLRVLELPWHLTMNDTGAEGAYVDIGFAFLGFLLISILFYKSNHKNRILLIFGLTYIFFWLIKANGIFWYGFPLLTFATLLMANGISIMNKNVVGKIILILVLPIWFIFVLNTRLNNFSNPIIMLSHADVVTYDDVRENIFPYSDELQKVLTENEGLVYKVGSPLAFFIPDFYKRTYDDQLIDNFYCTYVGYNRSPLEMIKILRDNGFRYLLFDSYTATIGLDPEGTLKKKVDSLIDFLNNHLELVIFDDVRGYHLLYIPSEEEYLKSHSE